MEQYSWNKASSKIRTWRTAKENNEMRLAEALFEYYKKEPMRRMLSILSYHAIKELTEKADKKNLAVFLEKTKKKYRFFRDDELIKRAFQDYNIGNDLIRNPKRRRDIFVKLLGEKRTKYFDPGDDADILCMYGEFIEEVGKGTYPASKKYFAPKTKDKKRITHESYRQARRKPRVSKEWTAADGKAVDFFMKGDRQKGSIGPEHKRIRAFRDEKERDARKEQLKAYGPMIDDKSKPGISLFQLDEASSIKQIDRMFGLMKGADISGTTADTVFAMEALWYHFHAGTMKSGPGWTDKDIAAWMEDALRIKEVLYLLPLVTMTYQAHHTLLECAFTLSINDYIDYSIGMYSSLIPQYWKGHEYESDTIKVEKTKKADIAVLKKEKKTAPWLEPERDEFKNAVTDLKKILQEHEDNKDNRYLLCYFADPTAEPKGVFVFDKKNPIEKKVFKRCANIKLNMKKIGETEEGEVVGWASELYSEDLQRRYPSGELVRTTVGWAASNEGCNLVAKQLIAEIGGADFKYTMTHVDEEEPEKKPDQPNGDSRLELREESRTDSRFVQDLFTDPKKPQKKR